MAMRRDTFKLLVFAGIIGFSVLYGMELSSKGIENVNGPLSTSGTNAGEYATENSGDWTLPVTEQSRNVEKRSSARTNAESEGDAITEPEDRMEEGIAIPRNDREPIVDRVSGKTGEVLHDLSRNGIRAVVSLFDRMLE